MRRNRLRIPAIATDIVDFADPRDATMVANLSRPMSVRLSRQRPIGPSLNL